MKTIAIFASLFLSYAAQADDSFEVIKDGKTFVCRVKANTDPGAAIRCAEKAYRGAFNRDQARQLCNGAINDAPADCGNSAYRGPFNREQALEICTGTVTTGPSECAAKAYRGPFNRDHAVKLCKREGSIANADCAIEAYRGPYSREEAVELCKAVPNHPSKMISKPKKAVL